MLTSPSAAAQLREKKPDGVQRRVEQRRGGMMEDPAGMMEAVDCVAPGSCGGLDGCLAVDAMVDLMAYAMVCVPECHVR